MQIIDGRKLAVKIRAGVKEEITRLGLIPGLAVILVGNDSASHLYVALKEKAAKEVGIHFEKHVFSGTESQAEIMARIQTLNECEDIHGMIVQMPLPKQYAEDVVISQIDPKKDADGFHQVNLRAILSGTPRIMPAVALSIVALIDEASPKGLKNKNAILLANRTEFAAPIEYLLEERGARVHICLRTKTITPDILTRLKAADVVVVARGHANFVNANMLKADAIVIDVGTNKLPSGKVVGDVDFASTQDKTGYITPVPGGVGPMTVAMLLKNTLELCKRNSAF